MELFSFYRCDGACFADRCPSQETQPSTTNNQPLLPPPSHMLFEFGTWLLPWFEESYLAGTRRRMKANRAPVCYQSLSVA